VSVNTVPLKTLNELNSSHNTLGIAEVLVHETLQLGLVERKITCKIKMIHI